MPQGSETYAIGRRKTSSARVILSPVEEGEQTELTVNKRGFTDYFPGESLQAKVLSPLTLSERQDKYNLKINVSGGGISGQAGALVLGIARALEKAEPELRPALKKAGMLRRDARIVERKKPGRHKARKKPQFSKR